MKYFAIVFASVVVSAVAFAQSKDARELLIETDQAWSRAASDGKDVEKVVSYWADDAVIMPAGGAVVSGKGAIRNYVREMFAIPGFSIGWEPRDASVSEDGTMGYTTGVNTVVYPGPDGKPVTQNGRYVAIWRRGSDGSWKCVYDTWNNGPAPE